MATTTADKSETRITLKGARLSFSDPLQTAKPTVKDGRPKHNANFILESDHKNFEVNKAKVMGAIRAAGMAKWKKEDAYKSIAEADRKRVCARKGDTYRNQETDEIYTGYEGNFVVSAAGPKGGRLRPTIVDRAKRMIWDSERNQGDENAINSVAYSGSYCDVVLSFYGTDEGGRGIFATIELVRSYQEGERTGGSFLDVGAALDELDDLDDLDDEPTTLAPTTAKAAGDWDDL